MRIDDENKVVWCSSATLIWRNSFYKNKNNLVSDLNLISALSTEKEVILPFIASSYDRYDIIKAIVNDYEFKLDEPQKYYWRKKKEYLAWFEKIEDSYLIWFRFSGEVDYYYTLGEVGSAPIEMTESEARDLLKDDFDKFEKVERE